MIDFWRRWTLRARLMTIGLVGLAISLAVGSITLYATLHIESTRRVDRAAAAASAEVASLIQAGRLPQTLPVTGVEVIQVIDAKGRVVSASLNADRLTSLLRPSELDDAKQGPVTVSGSRLGIDSRLRVRAAGVDAAGRPLTIVVGEPVDELMASDEALRLVLLIGCPLLLVIMGLIAWRVIGAALRPVEELRSAAEGISGSERDDRLPVPPSRDEIHSLAVTLNSMLERLQHAREREVDFVADAAHELRNPLASIRMQIDVARRVGQGSEVLDELDLDVARMSALVDDLLVMARIDAGVAIDDDASTSVRDDLQRVADAGVTAVRVELVPGPDAYVAARSDEVARVFTNLLANAARYASTVRISVTAGADRVVVYVDDDGPGIAPADRARAFERFTRLDEARDRDSGGTGLGLALVRGIVRSRGGDVSLSDSPIGGLRVRVELPAAAHLSDSGRRVQAEGLAE